MSNEEILPLFGHNYADEPVFLASNMLEAARIQKGLFPLKVPAGCLLDFDGELVDFLVTSGKAKLEPAWPCFHTRLYRWEVDGAEYGIIGGTVGASFAVLVAEELFALGCIRPRPEQCIEWGKEAGFRFNERNRYDLPPYHYGLIFRKPFA